LEKNGKSEKSKSGGVCCVLVLGLGACVAMINTHTPLKIHSSLPGNVLSLSVF
jgi:hypothetical protein